VTTRNLTQSAINLFQWYQDPSEHNERLAEVLSVDDAKLIFHINTHVNYPLLLKRIYNSENFRTSQKTLLSKWAPLFSDPDKLNESTAQSFLKDWVECLDHKLLFNRPIVAGSTRAIRSDPSSDSVTSYKDDRVAWTLHMITSGSAIYSAPVPLRAVPGSLILISPQACIKYQRDPLTEEWCHFWSLFQPTPEWLEVMNWPEHSEGIHLLQLEDKSDQKRIENLFKEAISLNGAEGALNDRLISNIIEQILIRAQITLTNNKIVAIDPRVIKAGKYISEHLNEHYSVADVAAVCNLSESRFSHLFKEQTGLGVKQYQNNLRLQLAKQLLIETTEPTAIIAEKLGLSDSARFSKFFSNNMGCSPRQFRVSSSGLLPKQ